MFFPWTVKYWGVGNESWGCGGNMRPEFYADEFRRYQTYCRNYGENRLYRIACGPNEGVTDWTDKVMSIAGRFLDGHGSLPLLPIKEGANRIYRVSLEVLLLKL